MSKEEILYISNALMWFVICWTPIILYTIYYTRNLNQNWRSTWLFVLIAALIGTLALHLLPMVVKNFMDKF